MDNQKKQVISSEGMRQRLDKLPDDILLSERSNVLPADIRGFKLYKGCVVYKLKFENKSIWELCPMDDYILVFSVNGINLGTNLSLSDLMNSNLKDKDLINSRAMVIATYTKYCGELPYYN